MIERRQDTRIVLVRIFADPLGRWAMHGDAFGCDHINADVERDSHPHFVFLDVSIEAGGFVLGEHVVGSLAIFQRARNMRHGGQGL